MKTLILLYLTCFLICQACNAVDGCRQTCDQGWTCFKSGNWCGCAQYDKIPFEVEKQKLIEGTGLV
jgi:hypothetical protein